MPTRFWLHFLIIVFGFTRFGIVSETVAGSRPSSASSQKKTASARKTSQTKRTTPTTSRAKTSKKSKSKKKTEEPTDGSDSFQVNASRPTPPLFKGEDAEETEGTAIPAEPAFTEFDLPTDNQMLFSKKHRDMFFQPTFSGRIISAQFGFVRNPGKGNQFTRFHEGVDIRPLQRDEGNEPRDTVYAAGDGTVVHLSRDESDSNYGKYVVIEHHLFGPPIYTLYAHLASVNQELQEGQAIKRSDRIGVMGRTSNQFEINTEYAHLHFEVNLMVNRRYIEWSRHIGDGTPNHGLYNGANLIGVDPVRFLQFLQTNPSSGIGDFVKREPVAFRVLVPCQEHFSWEKMYPFSLTKPPDDDPAALEIAMNYYGLPIRVTPKATSEVSKTRRRLLEQGRFPMTFASVKELTSRGPCKLLVSRNNRWKLSAQGREWLEQLLY